MVVYAREEPRADVSAGGSDLVQLAQKAQSGHILHELARDREPARPQRFGDDEDAPHEVVGRLLQRRAVAVRQ